MLWWNPNIEVPYNRVEFSKIINSLVFECPSSTRHEVIVGKKPNGKAMKQTRYKNVSARDCSFKSKEITGDLLITLLAQIRQPLVRNNTYTVLKSEKPVVEEVQSIINNANLGDSNYDLMVYQTRSDMPDSEAIYYYIRNAFAHGSFEVINENGNYIYRLESSRNDCVKAQMRLKETTLMHYICLANMSISEIKALQKPKKKH